jgi:hypothetical protein
VGQYLGRANALATTFLIYVATLLVSRGRVLGAIEK